MVDQANTSFHQEAARKANDLIRVYNPTDKDHVVKWDKRGGTKNFRVVAKEEAVLLRYLARKYVTEMFTKIITEKADKAIIEENEKRVAKGVAIMDKSLRTGEQLRFEAPLYKPTSEEAKKLVAILWVGVEQEFGIDREAEADDTPSDKPVLESAIETVAEEKGIVSADSPVDVVNDAPQPTTVPKKLDNTCDWPECGFEAKNSFGLMSHKRSHRVDEKSAQDLPKTTSDDKSEAIQGAAK